MRISDWSSDVCSSDLRKNGQEEIEYPHILLKPILEETYGIFVYQEQVMQAAQILAGYSLGDADLLRRAMGKRSEVRRLGKECVRPCRPGGERAYLNKK